MHRLRLMGVVVTCLAILLTGTGLLAQDAGSTQTLFEEMKAAEPQFGVVETIVTFENQGQKIAGTLALPDGGEAPYPIVLLFHGFKGERDELPIVGVDEGMYTRTARALAGQGYASLRIDFRGSGDSEGEWADTTFSSQIDDAVAALDYLETVSSVDASRIGIVGLSQGGLVAAAAAGRDPRVDTVVLWSAVAQPAATYPAFLGAELFSEGLTSGSEIFFTLPWGEETSLRQPFFQDVYNVDPVGEITRFAGPLMVVVGLRDTTVAPMPYMGQIYLNYHDGPEMLIAIDGDHVFDVLATGPEVLDEVIAWSLAWIKQTL